MSALVRLHVIRKLGFEKCLLYFDKLMSLHRCLSVGVSSSSYRNRCVNLFLYLCVFRPSVFFGSLVTRLLLTILDKRRPVYSKIFSQIHFVCFLCIARKHFSSSIENFRVCLRQYGLWSENIKTDVLHCGVDLAPLFG